MKNIITYVALSLFLFTGLAAQQPGEKLKAWKIAYYTQRLSLTPDEAKVFWPVYDQFEGERKIIRNRMRLENMEMKLNFDTMSEQEIESSLNEMIAGKQAEVDLYKKYMGEFRKTLPAKKVALLMRVEQDFKQEVIRKLQDQGGAAPRPQGGPKRDF